MPHIVVLATGGTIASRASGAGAGAAGGSVATDSAATILSRVGPLHADVTFESIDLMRTNSFNLTLADMADVCRAIADQLSRPEVDGIVVTHGTDTLEETSFLADLVHTDGRPVVFTGAQLAADDPSSDGPRNLRDALAIAAAPASHGRGVLVSFAGEVFAARGIRKAHTIAPQPFDNARSATIGEVVAGRVQYSSTPTRASTFALPSGRFGSGRVELISTYPGADGSLLKAVVDSGTRGIVISATGTGNPGSLVVAEIERAVASGVVVAVGSRVFGGPVIAVYGNGGAVDAAAAGAVLLGHLPAAQARILLALLLDRGDATAAAAELAAFVDTFDPPHLNTLERTHHG